MFSHTLQRQWQELYDATVAANHSGNGLLQHSRLDGQLQPASQGDFYTKVQGCLAHKAPPPP
jgi:hypothetical protein